MSGDAPTAENQPAPSEAEDIIRHCTRAINEYEAGVIDKMQAIAALSTQLSGPQARESGAADGTTFKSYLAMLDEVDRRRGDETGERRSVRPSRAATSRDPSPGSDSDSPQSKRPRVDPGKYAWAATEFLAELQLHPDVVKTLELIRTYGEDLAAAKRDLNATASAPEFPESEWAKVLTGRAVDLDLVFAGRYNPATDTKHVERVGDFELSLGVPVASKKITSFGDWVFAWHRATEAVAFAFPHRREELREYGEYMVGLFGALAPPLHSRALNFDRAVRKRVGSSRRLRLTDFDKFSDLKLQYIDSSGANVYKADSGSGGGSGGRRGGGSRAKEACRKWNSANGCPHKASKCRFRHICSGCGAEGHKRPECTKSAQRTT
ncbi:hypothetical protein C8Q79DRAFT_912871 [Trametes meyenii]|nr:hypothetical protein C8Q79DRAFT_912871 [Trametes meyenii]